jgi:FAS-associated factor 2
MATDGEFDVGQLSASQQEALQQYTDVTGQDTNEAIPLLQRSQWNIQVRLYFNYDARLCFNVDR